MITRETKRMGCPFSITVVRPPSLAVAAVERAIALAFGEISRIEDLLTDFRESPLVALNRAAADGPCPVPEELFRLVDYALAVSRDCDGAFDVTYAAVGQLWRAAFASGVPPEPETLAEARERVGFPNVILDHRKRTIAYRRPGVRIGLGGVGKGYAVDAAFRVLQEMGFENFLVNGAGDIRVASGRNAARPWRIGIKNPFSPQSAGVALLQVPRGGVATSGDYERFMIVGGKRYHHIIDARTGEIREDPRSVTVLAPCALQADVYATTAMSLGLPDGLDFLARHRGVSALVITRDGRVHTVGIPDSALRPLSDLHQPTGVL